MAKDRFLSARRVFERWNISQSTLQGWRRFCPALGRPIKTRRLPNGQRNHLYSVGDLERIENAPSVDKGVHIDKHGRWLTWTAASAKFHFGHKNLGYWRRKSAPTLGRAISAKQLVSKSNGRTTKRWVYLEADLQIIAEEFLEGSAPSEFITVRDASNEFRFPKPTVIDWLKKGCPLLGGRPIDSRIESRKIGNRMMRVRVLSVEDLRAVESARVKGITDAREWPSVSEAAREIGINVTTMHDLKTRPHPALDDRVINSKPGAVKVGRWAFRSARLYDPADVRLLRDYYAKRDVKTVEGDLLTLAEAASLLGTHREAVRSMGRKGVKELGGAPIRLTTRKIPDARGYYRKAQCVFKQDIEAILIARGKPLLSPPEPPPAPAPRRRGRPKDERTAQRDKRIRELCKRHDLTGQWAKLARLANEDATIIALDLPKPISRTAAMNAVLGRRQTLRKIT